MRDQEVPVPARGPAGPRFVLPWASLLLVLLLAAAHVALRQLAHGVDERVSFLLILSGAKVNPLIAQGEWWRLLAAAFLHGPFTHLAVNGIGVLLLGWLVERLLGPAAVLVIFTLGGLAGSVASYCTSAAPSAGASAAMFGLLGAAAVAGLVQRRRIPGALRTYAIGLPLVIGVTAIAWGFSMKNVDNPAHLGGLGCGVALGLLWPLLVRLGGLAGRLLRGLTAAALALAVVFALGTTAARLALRFELPESRLEVWHPPGLSAFFRPAGWDVGTLDEGRCVLGGIPLEEELPVLCFVDPFYTMYLVAPLDRLLATPVYAAYAQAGAGGGTSLYENDRVLFAADRSRRLGFALVAYDAMTDKYLPLFAALQAVPSVPE